MRLVSGVVGWYVVYDVVNWVVDVQAVTVSVMMGNYSKARANDI